MGNFALFKNSDYENVKKYTSDFKNEDIIISIFDAGKNLIATSKPDNSKKMLSKNPDKHTRWESKWKTYKYSLKNKMIEDVKEISAGNKKYY